MNNFHVILVHFPIAVLTLYSLLEIIRIRRVQNFLHHFHLKAFLVITGAITAALAALTGKLIEANFRHDPAIRAVLHLHSTMGEVTIVYFGFFALLYLIAWLGRENLLDRLWLGWLKPFLEPIEKFLGSWWMVLAGILGVLIITVTGALGGIIVYGPQVDPIASFIYNFLHLGG